MSKKMLIDATHQEEVRLSIVADNKLEEFDFETSHKAQIKGNVYLAQVTRVEPSLQAAFVEYGGNRQGFLPFSEIHPDYYQIPIEDRQDMEEYIPDNTDLDEECATTTDEDADVEDLGGESLEVEEQSRKSRPRLKRRYKIQEVIKNRQILLIQAVKEERGNKGAAMTTYLSLAGRYCVLMPNSPRGGGVSRKIVSSTDRKRLKDILNALGQDKNGGVILRTAGARRTKAEIKRDYTYIYALWDKIRETTLQSIAPALIHTEAGLIHRAIRDMYNKDIEEIIVAGEDGYKIARDFMKELSPSHARKVKKYKTEAGISLFQRYQVESQISHIYDSNVTLPSGGSIVLHQTEALVAIDVNSGRSIGERNVDATAIKTNLEAAEEVARQLRLRDMAGLIVIDFIDMEDKKSNMQVERRLKDTLQKDRARIQVGRISQFGLLEMSRQRLRPSLIEASSTSCPSCGGSGMVPNLETAAMSNLRSIEEEVFRKRSTEIKVSVPTDVGFYLLNSKRQTLSTLEQDFAVTITLQTSPSLVAPAYEMIRIDEDGTEIIVGASSENNTGGRKRKRKRNKSQNTETSDTQVPMNTNKANTESKPKNTPKKSKRNRRKFNKNTDGTPTQDTGTPTEIQSVTQDTPKKVTTKKAKAKKATVKKANAKKATAKKTRAKKATAKKTISKKTTTKKATPPKSTEPERKGWWS